METEALASPTPDRRRVKSPSPFLRGMTMAPFGLVLGFSSTALPFLLTHQGVPVDRAARISATVFFPAVIAWLVKPMLDTGLTRRAYSWLLVTIGAIAFSTGMLLLDPAHLRFAVPALVIASLALVLYTGAVNGWISATTLDSERGIVAGWSNVANLGAGALGSFAVMTLLTRGIVTQREIAFGLGAFAMIMALPLLTLPDPAPPAFRFREVLTKTPIAIWNTVRRPECLVGFALFLTPAAGSAAQNLQSTLGPAFHAAASTVIWATGIAAALSTSVGAWIGGKLADRFPRMYLYLTAGCGTAITAVVTAFLPHTPMVFIASTLIYNFAIGIIYSAYNALAFELTGDSPVASTQLGMFAASANFNIWYMTRLDGIGYHWAGVRGLYLVDGLCSLAAILPLFVLVSYLRRKKPVAA